MKITADITMVSVIHGLLLWIRPPNAKIAVIEEVFLIIVVLLFCIAFSRRAWNKVEKLTAYGEHLLLTVAGFLIGIFCAYQFGVLICLALSSFQAIALGVVHGLLVIIPLSIVLAHTIYSQLMSRVFRINSI